MEKKCKKCGKNYPESSFHKTRADSNKLRNICKNCHNLYGLNYTRAHKEYNTQWYQRNKERINLRNRAYHKVNKERLNLLSKTRYYAKHEYWKAQRRAYNRIHKEEIIAKKLIPANWFRAQLLRLSHRRKFVFLPNGLIDLTNELCILLQNNKYCPYTQQPLILGVNLHIDHIVPIGRGGAVLDINNLQLVSEQYNRAKHDLTDSEFARHWKLTYIP